MKQLKVAVSVLALSALAGCAVGPDFKQPDAPQAGRITNQPLPAQTASANANGGDSQVFVAQSATVPADWWTLFNSPVLNGLVRDALAANSDLAAARAALAVANANAAVERAAFFPGLSAGFDATRQQTSGTLSPVLSGPAQTFNLYTPQLTISYVPDLFGGTRRTVESAEAQAHAQEFALRAAHLTLASNVALAAIQYASLSDQLAAQQKLTDSAEALRALMQDQLSRGAIAAAAVGLQDVVVMQARAALAALK
jgi:outer membrane protein TolC